jgi:ribonuclease HII
VPQIAAASVVAKVMRDRLMRALARRHPPAHRVEGGGTHVDAVDQLARSARIGDRAGGGDGP